MKKVNIDELLARRGPRENLNLFWVDGKYALRVAKVQGTFPLHHHPDSDEGWFVYKGQITIQTNQGDITLKAGEAAMVPKGLVHAPRADIEGSIVMIINGRDFKHEFEDDTTDEKAGYTEEDVEVG